MVSLHRVMGCVRPFLRDPLDVLSLFWVGLQDEFVGETNYCTVELLGTGEAIVHKPRYSRSFCGCCGTGCCCSQKPACCTSKYIIEDAQVLSLHPPSSPLRAVLRVCLLLEGAVLDSKSSKSSLSLCVYHLHVCFHLHVHA